MAEEAVVRIVLDGSGATGAGTTDGASSTPPPTSTPSPPPSKTPHRSMGPEYDPSSAQHVVMRDVITDKIKKEEIENIEGRLNPPPLPTPDRSDPRELAKKDKERKSLKDAKDAEYAKLYPDDQSGVIYKKNEREKKKLERAKPQMDPEFDPADAAKKRLEREKQRAEIDAEYAKLNPPEPPPNAHQLTLKRLEREKQRQEVEREYYKLNPPTPKPEFDPREVAIRRRESQRRGAQVDEAYNKEYGEPSQKSALDVMFARISTLRGTLGSLLGTMVGAGLDVFHILRREQGEQEKKKKKRELLKEAHDLAANKFEGTVGKYETNTSTTPRAIDIGSALNVANRGQGVGDQPSKSKPPDLPSASGLASAVGAKDISKAPDDYKVKTGVAGMVEKFGGMLLSALDRAVERYGDYSLDISQAKAMVDVNKTLNDLRRAEKYGPELAKYVESQGRMQERFEEAKMKLLIKTAPVIEGIFEVLGTMAENIDLLPAAIATAIALKSGNPFAVISAGVIDLVTILSKMSDKTSDEEIPNPLDALYEGDPGELFPEV